MTVRELLSSAIDLDKVVKILYTRDQCMDNPPTNLEETENMYLPVIDELLKLPPQPPDMTIRVRWTEHHHDPDLDEDPYLDVDLVNHNYVEPPKDAKPWGGDSNDQFDAPDGYYNINWDNYNQYFGMSFTEWIKLIDSPIVKADNITWEEAAATFLWEMTFYGWTWDDAKKVKDEIVGRKEEYDLAAEEGRLVIEKSDLLGGMEVVSIKPKSENDEQQ